MEEHGHVVTGMNNHIVWGLPHVFAFFLIVAASGALNVASMASVFGRGAYKPLRAAVGAPRGGAAGRRPRGAGARSRPAGAAPGRDDALQFQIDLRLEHDPVHRLLRHRRAVSVLLLARRIDVCQARRPARVRLAHHADDGHRVDPGLPGGAAGLRLRRHGAAVHRHVARVGPGGLPPRAVLVAGWPGSRSAASSSRACAGCSASSRAGRSISRPCSISPISMGEACRGRAVHPARAAATYTALFWVGLCRRWAASCRSCSPSAAAAGARDGARPRALVSLGALAYLYVFIVGGQAFPLLLFPGKEVGERLPRRLVAPTCRAFPSSGWASAASRRSFAHRAGRRARVSDPAAGEAHPGGRAGQVSAAGRRHERGFLVSAAWQVVRQDDHRHRPHRRRSRRAAVGADLQEGTRLHRSPCGGHGRPGGPAATSILHLQDAPRCRACARHAGGCDLALIEGNNGLHDGVDLEGGDSSAALAHRSRCRSSWSSTRGHDARRRAAPARARGLRPDVRIAGVILNRVGNARQESKLRAAIERYTRHAGDRRDRGGRRGWRLERHLGLGRRARRATRRPAWRRSRRGLRQRRPRWLVAIARTAAPVAAAGPPRRPPAPDVRIAVAQRQRLRVLLRRTTWKRSACGRHARTRGHPRRRQPAGGRRALHRRRVSRDPRRAALGQQGDARRASAGPSRRAAGLRRMRRPDVPDAVDLVARTHLRDGRRHPRRRRDARKARGQGLREARRDGRASLGLRRGRHDPRPRIPLFDARGTDPALRYAYRVERGRAREAARTVSSTATCWRRTRTSEASAATTGSGASSRHVARQKSVREGEAAVAAATH